MPSKIFNRILAPYVENLDLNQVNYGIGQGTLTLFWLMPHSDLEPRSYHLEESKAQERSPG